MGRLCKKNLWIYAAHGSLCLYQPTSPKMALCKRVLLALIVLGSSAHAHAATTSSGETAKKFDYGDESYEEDYKVRGGAALAGQVKAAAQLPPDWQPSHVLLEASCFVLEPACNQSAVCSSHLAGPRGMHSFQSAAAPPSW